MKRVFSSADSLLVHHVKNLLETAGIACQLRNEFLMGGAGDLPVLDCWPEIWVEDEQIMHAQRIVREHASGTATPAKAWTCLSCGTACEGQFDRCWQCGELRTS